MAIARSISMSQIPKRSASFQTQSNPPVQPENRVETIMKKGYNVLERLMFTKKNEHAKKYDKSATNPLLQLMAFAGICWLTARNMPQWSVILVAVYNASVFLVQSIYLILLVIDFHVTNVGEYKWITTSFYLYAILLAISLWLNIRLHLIRSNTIAEAICSYSVSSKFVSTKNKILKIVCFLFIFFVFLFIGMFILAYKLSNDLFGVGSAKPSHTIFSCGLFCNVAFYYVSGIIITTIVSATGMFTLLTVSTLMEAKQLNVDVRKYPSNDGLDHLIFRYQSVDQSAYAINKHFSCIIFGLIFLTIGGIIVLLRHYTQLMIGQWETGAALLIFYFILGCVSLAIFLGLGTLLNDKLSEFRRASQRVSDFQQIYTTNQNSIKLLSFMLRLSNSKQHLKIAGICSINQQTIFTLIIVSLVFGLMLYTSDSGCLHLF